MISNQPVLRLCRFETSILPGCLFVLTAFAKNVDDVVVLKNGDRLTGEIKSKVAVPRETSSPSIIESD
jgi:hypothetical protein